MESTGNNARDWTLDIRTMCCFCSGQIKERATVEVEKLALGIFTKKFLGVPGKWTPDESTPLDKYMITKVLSSSHLCQPCINNFLSEEEKDVMERLDFIKNLQSDVTLTNPYLMFKQIAVVLCKGQEAELKERLESIQRGLGSRERHHLRPSTSGSTTVLGGVTSGSGACPKKVTENGGAPEAGNGCEDQNLQPSDHEQDDGASVNEEQPVASPLTSPEPVSRPLSPETWSDDEPNIRATKQRNDMNSEAENSEDDLQGDIQKLLDDDSDGEIGSKKTRKRKVGPSGATKKCKLPKTKHDGRVQEEKNPSKTNPPKSRRPNSRLDELGVGSKE